jgi:hypothetical protein
MKVTIDLIEFEKRLKVELREDNDIYVPLSAVIRALKLAEVKDDADKKPV